MNIVTYKISDLKHPDYNPRKISEDQKAHLKKSLEKFDCVEPAVININPERKNIIIGGNQRVDVAESMGWIEFPCVEINLDLQNEKELNIRLNKNTGEFDYGLLATEFEIDDLIEWGFEKDDLNFDVDELKINDLDYEDEEKTKNSLTITYLKNNDEQIRKMLDKIILDIPGTAYHE